GCEHLRFGADQRGDGQRRRKQSEGEHGDQSAQDATIDFVGFRCHRFPQMFSKASDFFSRGSLVGSRLTCFAMNKTNATSKHPTPSSVVMSSGWNEKPRWWRLGMINQCKSRKCTTKIHTAPMLNVLGLRLMCRDNRKKNGI